MTPTLPRTRVKICGITRPQDAWLAAELGADAIGLNFYAGSPRAITPAQVPEIVAGLPPLVTVVALFVDPTTAWVRAVMETGKVNCLQFHGSESPAFLEAFSLPRIKAVRVRDAQSLQALDDYAPASALLLDAYHPQAMGGTGTVFDWTLAQQYTQATGHAIILAGGLDADNVGEAIHQVRPWAVDVSSGVESAPGIKDEHRMRRFFAAVRAADEPR